MQTRWTASNKEVDCGSVELCVLSLNVLHLFALVLSKCLNFLSQSGLKLNRRELELFFFFMIGNLITDIFIL